MYPAIFVNPVLRLVPGNMAPAMPATAVNAAGRPAVATHFSSEPYPADSNYQIARDIICTVGNTTEARWCLTSGSGGATIRHIAMAARFFRRFSPADGSSINIDVNHLWAAYVEYEYRSRMIQGDAFGFHVTLSPDFVFRPFMRHAFASLLVAALLNMRSASAGNLVVIVNPASGVIHLTRNEVIDIFLGRYRKLPSGAIAIPIDLRSDTPRT